MPVPLSDRWNKKATMLICDAAAALTTVGVLVLLSTDALCVWHLYVLNALNGLINTCAGLAMVIGSVIASLRLRRKAARASSVTHCSFP